MYNIETFREYCIRKKEVTESFPFNETVLVMKVLNKMFALTDLNSDFSITVKAAPEKLIQLTEAYENITPAYHFNKKHWLNIKIDGSFSAEFIENLINDSYNLVVKGLTKKQQKIIFPDDNL